MNMHMHFHSSEMMGAQLRDQQHLWQFKLKHDNLGWLDTVAGLCLRHLNGNSRVVSKFQHRGRIRIPLYYAYGKLYRRLAFDIDSVIMLLKSAIWRLFYPNVEETPHADAYCTLAHANCGLCKRNELHNNKVPSSRT